jgi:hypothetical protein
LRLTGVSESVHSCEFFDLASDWFAAEQFRKIKPDQQSGERTDWELLLDSVNAGKVEA